MRLFLLTVLLAAAVCAASGQSASTTNAGTSTTNTGSSTTGAGASTPDAASAADYGDAIGKLSEEITKSSEQMKKLRNEQMAFVTADPGELITKEIMGEMSKANSFEPMKAGTKSISLRGSQGFNGLFNYNPASWKIAETMSGPSVSRQDTSHPKQPVFSYPSGIGNVLLNHCTENNYTVFSPCQSSKQYTAFSVCTKMMDAAAFIGVGFDGRGYYNSDSRKVSLIQRVCAKKTMFHSQEVPDMMNVFGIFHTVAETKSFQSVDQYMRYVREKAGVSNQKGLFTSEASKYSEGKSFAANLGGILSAVGTGVGTAFGGPVGAMMGAQLGGAVGGAIAGGSASGSGDSSSTDDSESSSEYEQTESSSTQQGNTQTFFAMMFVNIILYEVTMDEVKPTDLSLSFLKDYMDLPVSYYSVGAEVKYQHFLLRWGTHFIRSGKFGGQLKVTKTMKSTQSMTSDEFASISETEFQSMFSTLQSKRSQFTDSWDFLGFGEKKQNAEQSSEAQTETEYKSTSNQENSLSQDSSQSKYTQTNVEAQGGRPEIAEAIMDFYTPAFKQLFDDWIVSIKDYPKPFEFQLESIDDLVDMRMDDLFPVGELDYGCLGGGGNNVTIVVEAETNRRFYIDTRVTFNENVTIEEKIKVYCKYSNVQDFMSDLDRKRISLERAITVYILEGPFPTVSYELPAGEVGCEEKTLAALQITETESAPMTFLELMSAPFLLTFDLPQSVDGVVSETAKFKVIFRQGTWYAIDPYASYMHLYDGCELSVTNGENICFRNIILTYDDTNGLFYIKSENFKFSKLRMPSLPNWLSGSTVARASRLKTIEDSRSRYQREEISIPCNVKWINAHRLDPHKDENCIHFSAATAGDIFVIFASIPRNHHTWIYVQINPEGVSFYKGLELENRVVRVGMGVLGDPNLFQSYFVCVVQKNNSILLQYGKSDPDSEIGTIFSSYRYPHIANTTKLSFYSFGSGEMSVALEDIRLTRQLPVEVNCLDGDFIKVDGMCVLDCHYECVGCKRAQDSRGCHQCKNARVEIGTGVGKVTECFADCPPGHFPSPSSENLCLPCPGGSFKNVSGNLGCTPCPNGTFSAEGANECSPCAAGTFNDKEGQPICPNCPAGTFSGENGASSCEQCPLGYFSVAGVSECEPCPPGRYGNVLGLVSCLECEIGTFSASTGQTACDTCPVGSVATSLGSTECITCPPGTKADSTDGSECKKCPLGTYGQNGAECLPCSPGHYSDEENAAECKQCQPGTSASESGSSSCTPCESGKFAKNWASPYCEPCGGDPTISTSTGCYKYEDKGCFVDKPDKDIAAHDARMEKNNNRDCAIYCFDLGFRVIGTQYGEYCMCGNSYGKYGPGTGCDMSCPGQPASGWETMGVRCGGPWHNNVWQIVELENRCPPGTFVDSSSFSGCTACPEGSTSADWGSASCVPQS